MNNADFKIDDLTIEMFGFKSEWEKDFYELGRIERSYEREYESYE